ncbi:hypothetical protein CYMTET_36618 [Cymbomonas tetramitiformis]|uniref:Uncharacterized protein n=1 Tax=Cymbomonas tetramitiformis TaxID=36881 RepID=A0AAE0CHU7_9CHLO|nr:hypothetical protein CYMTET_36618 [Cymbomonas tetramitiformis]
MPFLRDVFSSLASIFWARGLRFEYIALNDPEKRSNGQSKQARKGAVISRFQQPSAPEALDIIVLLLNVGTGKDEETHGMNLDRTDCILAVSPIPNPVQAIHRALRAGDAFYERVEYVNDFDKINLTSLDGYDEAARLEGSVLVVEATGADVTVPVVLSRSATRLLGIVVRRGGVLFMDDIDSELDLHFMIVESGGLFQAGARHSAAHRFMSKLVITYEYDQWGDGGNAPLTASEYSVEVRGFSGAVANNHGVAKGLAVFFNGNYQLNAVIPGRVRYAGTWSVDRTCPSSQHCRMDVRETVREAEAPLGEDEDAYHVAAEYPMTWARLGRPHYVGDWYLVLNAEDCHHDGWRTDDRLVLTAAPTQFADRDTDSFTGAPRNWMDHDPNSTAYRDNEKALHDHDRHFSDDRQACLGRSSVLSPHT